VKIILAVLPLLILASQSFSNPASNTTFPLKQPDGTVVEVRQEGNEWFHVLETVDGHILLKDSQGFYAYADENGKPSKIYARDARDRSPADVLYLSGLNQDDIYKKLYSEHAVAEKKEYDAPKYLNSVVKRIPTYNRFKTLGDVRVPVILVQYADVKFKSADPVAQYTDYLNKEGYNEYHNVGSVRDYFIQNSNGLYRPTFDVYGPVTLSKKRSQYGSRDGSAMKEAQSLLNWDEIDMSLYGGGYAISYAAFIVAGVGSNGTSVDEALWPHAGRLNGSQLWGHNTSMVDYYSSSVEISSGAYVRDESTSVLDGIGVFVHEFSHLLGLEDHYDVGGENKHATTKTWDVMDTGNHNCPSNPEYVRGCAPPNYSAFERMSLGWLTPTELSESGPVRLDKIEKNVAYSVTNPNNPNEVFLLEYRSMKGWDVGHYNSGMLIWHIDYDSKAWLYERVNVDGDHMHVDIVEAVPEKYNAEGDYYTVSTFEVPFPGSGHVTEFNKFVFWDGRNANIAISSIKESEDHEYVVFNVCMNASTCPTIEWSSSSFESSSSEMPPSSSVESSSSEFPDLSSSSEESSSSETLSSSDIAPESSSEESSSSEEVSSSSETVLSSSVSESRSSSSFVESSSSEIPSSSSVESSSSELPELSSSSEESSSSETFSSSSIEPESSSKNVESSSSEQSVNVVSKIHLQGVRISSCNGVVNVYAPQQGVKTVRIFSPLGSLMLETVMDDFEQNINVKNLRNPNVVLSVTQEGKTLFKGVIRVR